MKQKITLDDVKRKYDTRRISEYADHFRVGLYGRNQPNVDFYVPNELPVTDDGLLWPTDFRHCPEIAQKLHIVSDAGTLQIPEDDIGFIFGDYRKNGSEMFFYQTDASRAMTALVKVRCVVGRFPWASVKGVKSFRNGRGVCFLEVSLSNDDDLAMFGMVTRKDLRNYDLEQRHAIKAHEKNQKAKKQGLPSNVRIWNHRGQIHAGGGWVIRPDGLDRRCDFFEPDFDYDANFEHDKTGWMIWKQIREGELVLKWEHSYASQEHVFAVVYAPEEITGAQLERVALIEGKIRSFWSGRHSAYFGENEGQIDGWKL